ncbi:MAG: acid shock protein [Lachnospiraceae bacterium]|nr:acid shock protein [Lachnospiraceae bacterium]
MKKTLALILTLAMVLSLTACGSPKETTAAPTEAPTTEAPTTAAPTTEAPTEAPLEVAGTVYVLNSVLADLQTYNDPDEVRYNANYMTIKGWNLGNIADRHFWFNVADDQKAYIVSYDDGYTYAPKFGTELTYKVLRDQLLCLDVPEDMQENHYNGFIYGPDMRVDELVWGVGFVVVGPEAFLLGNDDEKGYNAEDILHGSLIGGTGNVAKLVEADSYDFIGIDGYSEEIFKEDLKDVNIYFNEGRVDADSVAWPGYTITDIQYIVPHGVDKDNLPETEDGIVYKITVLNTAILEVTEKKSDSYLTAKLDTDDEIVIPVKGSAQVGYKVTEVLDALELKGYKEVTTVSLLDGQTWTCSFDDFLAKYIVEQDAKYRGPYTVGRTQKRGEFTTNVEVFVLDSDGIVYVQDDATEEAGLSVADLLEKMGATGVKAINVVCSDGYSNQTDAADLDKIFLFHKDGRIDATYLPDPKYTLEGAVKIEILK